MKTVSKLFLIASLCFFFSCKQVKTSDTFTAMNTFMTVNLYAESQKKGNNLCNQVHEKIDQLEKMLSTTLEISDVYKINHRLPYDFSNDELKNLLDFCMETYQKTECAFNPALYPVIREWGFTTENYHVPEAERISELLKKTDFSKVTYAPLADGMELDFGAIGKGYAADKAVELLKSQSVKSAILDFGGNIQTIGRKSDGSLWRVGIKNPWGQGAACALSVEDSAVVTSGGYERFFEDENGNRYIHIFDPSTGYPSQSDIESVTIVCSRGTYADALSTSLFVMGSKKAIEFWKTYQDFEAIMITKNHQLIYTQGLKENLEALIDFKDVITVSRTQDES